MKLDNARKKRISVYILILFTVTGFSYWWFYLADSGPLKIGVLFHLSGPLDMDLHKPLNWIVEDINKNGGLNGRQIELVYKDISQFPLKEAAMSFINDPSIKIVIGPITSDESYDLAPLFIKNKKILISPTSTSAELFRAFGKKKFYWRTSQGDVAQIKSILHILKIKGAKSISLLYEDTSYGKTFLDWSGFFALEMNLDLYETQSFQRKQTDFQKEFDILLDKNPDYLLTVGLANDVVTIQNQMLSQKTGTKLFLTDSAQTSYLLKHLGDHAEGLEGTAPSIDPSTGFFQVYFNKFGVKPTSFSATAYDAMLLAIYTLARNDYKHGWEWIEDSLFKVVSGRGKKVLWNETQKGIELLLSGKRPNIEGASGTLEFDKDYGVDPLHTYYSHWTVENNSFTNVQTISSGDIIGGMAEQGSSVYRTKASSTHFSTITPDSGLYIPKDKHDLWAVIIATSKDWNNYRHQADALAMYHLLKRNGVSDDNIILFLIDDIPYAPENPLEGQVRHVPAGEDVRKNVIIDYVGEQVTVKNLKNVLMGIKTDETPVVLDTNEHSNIFVFMVDHGLPGRLPFDFGPPLTSYELKKLVQGMYDNKRYRQMFIMVEICFGESMALDLDTPGVIYFTGSALNEQSFGANYDSEVKAWLADDFTHKVIMTISRNQNIYLSDLYIDVYGKVSGSHVRLKNCENFGNVAGTQINEFIRP